MRVAASHWLLFTSIYSNDDTFVDSRMQRMPRIEMEIRFRLSGNNIYALRFIFSNTWQIRPRCFYPIYRACLPRFHSWMPKKKPFLERRKTFRFILCTYIRRWKENTSSILDSRSSQLPLIFEIPLKRNTHFEKCLHLWLTNRSSNCWIFI